MRLSVTALLPAPPDNLPWASDLNLAIARMYRDLANALNNGLPVRPQTTVADQPLAAADTYLTGSKLDIPLNRLRIGTVVRWTIAATKTAAGVATPIFAVRVGKLGTVADAAILTFTGPVQTAAVDAGIFTILATLRNVGAAGILAGVLSIQHNGNAAGFANVPNPILQVTSAGFDTRTPGLIAGVSANFGAASAVTTQIVVAEALGL